MHQSFHPRNERSQVGTMRAAAITLVQVCPSIHRECGVGNFARNCAAALADVGVDVSTVADFPDDLQADLLIQHEYALFNADLLRARLTRHQGRAFLFAHSPHADRVFGNCVDGFITLCDGMTEAGARTLVLPHPGWQSSPPADRHALKARYQWGHYRCVVGTNGFISPSRQFDEVARRFLPFAEQENVLVQVIGTRHHSHDNRPGYRDQERRLRALADAYPQNLALEFRFLDQEELHRRLQACDLTWCWTATPSGPYGSGTCADQYGSGTRLVVVRKRQHAHVLALPNVVVAPDDLDGFVEILKAEALQSSFPRHDPSPLSWQTFSERLLNFIVTCPPRTALPSVHDTRNDADATAPQPSRLDSTVPRLTMQTAARAAEQHLATIKPYPGSFSGQGIVTCAGGVRYLTCAWVLLRTLRRLGCTLPVEVWCYAREVDPGWAELAKSFNAVVRVLPEESLDADPRWSGWRLKPAAVLHSSFHEVLYLDADNVPVRDPTELFTEPEYLAHGTIFWPDAGKVQRGSDQWSIFGVPYRDESEVESGQILVDKAVAWKALNLCDWYNKHAEFFYRYCYGDKDTFRFAWRKAGIPYAMPPFPAEEHPHFLVQQDFAGHALYQHRCRDKWRLSGNRRLPGFLFEEQCLADVAELRSRWSPKSRLGERVPADQEIFERLAGRTFHLMRIGRSAWKITLGDSGQVTAGWTANTTMWNVSGGELIFASAEGDPTYRLTRRADGVWEGGSRMPIRLIPVA